MARFNAIRLLCAFSCLIKIKIDWLKLTPINVAKQKNVKLKEKKFINLKVVN